MILLLRILSGFFALLPRPIALGAGRGLGWFVGTILRFRRREARERLVACMPTLRPVQADAVVAGMYSHLGMTLVEQLRISVRGLAEYDGLVTVVGREHQENARAEGRGLLTLMAHVGNWELCGYATRLLDCPVSVVVKPMKDPAAQAYLARTRERMNLRLLPPGTSFRDCVAALKNQEALSVIIDQNTKASRGIFVDFFGRPACTTPGLALIAALTRTPVVPLFVLRTPDDHYEMHFLEPIPPPPNRDPETLHRFTQTYTRVVEDMIRRHPDQWIWIHRRWRTTPPSPEDPA